MQWMMHNQGMQPLYRPAFAAGRAMPQQKHKAMQVKTLGRSKPRYSPATALGQQQDDA
jgi:hypothetical protein